MSFGDLFAFDKFWFEDMLDLNDASEQQQGDC